MKTPRSTRALSKLREWRWPAVAGFTAFAVGLGMGAGWSVWSANIEGEELLAMTGDLDLGDTTAQAYWRRTTPGYPAALNNPDYVPPCGALTVPDGETETGTSSIPGCANPQSITVMPGDVLEYVMPITTNLAGNNLAAAFSVSITDSNLQAAYDAGLIDLSYYVAEPITAKPGQYNQIAPAGSDAAASLGDTVTLPEVAVTNGSTPDNCQLQSQHLICDYAVIAQVTVLGYYTWAADFSGNLVSAQTASTGAVCAGDNFTHVTTGNEADGTAAVAGTSVGAGAGAPNTLCALPGGVIDFSLIQLRAEVTAVPAPESTDDEVPGGTE